MPLPPSAFEFFHHVARSGSISRAAAELGLEPSTLTRHIGRLEEDVGTKLFHRSGRGMVLTEAGVALLREADRMVAALQDTRRVAAELAVEGPSRLIIAAMPTLAQLTAGPLALALRARFPQASLRLVEGMGHHLVHWLQAGEVDAALLYVPTQTGMVDYDVLLHEPLYAVLPPGHALEAEAPLAVEALLDQPLVLPSTPHGLRALASGWAERYGKPLQLAAEADNSTVLSRRLVQAGLGCTVLPLAAVHEEVAHGLLRVRRLEGAGTLREVAIATARNRPPVSGLWELTREIRQVAAQLVAQGRWPGVERMAG